MSIVQMPEQIVNDVDFLSEQFDNAEALQKWLEEGNYIKFEVTADSIEYKWGKEKDLCQDMC